MPIFRLSKRRDWFPPPTEWEADEDIIAVGGDLHPERLWSAYQIGAFPWNEPDAQLLWWHPRERMVLEPSAVKVSKSSRNLLNRRVFQFSLNQCFDEVIRQCQTIKRPGQEGGTWISEEHCRAFNALHEQGSAHSVEVWRDGQLVGGLYGLLVGSVFMGESMFSRESNAGKLGFIQLCRKLEQLNIKLIDCQIYNPYLASLGAGVIDRSLFLAKLKRYRKESKSLHQSPIGPQL